MSARSHSPAIRSKLPSPTLLKKLISKTRSRFQKNIVLVFACVAITIALFVKLISINNTDAVASDNLVTHTYNITRYAQSIQSNLAQSESSVRGYLLSHHPRPKETVLKLQNEVHQQLSEMEQLLQDSTQKKCLAELNRQINTQFALQSQLISQETGANTLQQYLQYDNQERRNLQAIQSTFGMFMDRQNILLQERSRASHLAKNRALTTVIIGTIIVFIFITCILIRLNQDIRRRKKAEIDTRNSEKKYRQLIEDAGVTIFTCNLNGVFTYVSEKSYQLTGYTPDELQGKSFATLVTPEWVDTVAEEYRDQLRKLKEEATMEFLIYTASHEERWVEQHAVLLYDEHYSPIGYHCIVRDITEKKESAKRAKKTETAMHALLNSTKEGFMLVSREFAIQLVNKEARRDIESYSGKTILEEDNFLRFFAEHERPTVKENFSRVFAGEHFDYETCFETPNGPRWMMMSHSPVRNSKGQVTGAAVVSYDVTDKHKQNLVLLRS